MENKDYTGNVVKYDKESQQVFTEKNNLLLDVRGWGSIHRMFDSDEDAIKFQNGLGEWIAEAINEKLEKESKYML